MRNIIHSTFFVAKSEKVARITCRGKGGGVVSTMFKGKGVSFLGWFPNIIGDNTMILILPLSSQYEMVTLVIAIFNSLDLT